MHRCINAIANLVQVQVMACNLFGTNPLPKVDLFSIGHVRTNLNEEGNQNTKTITANASENFVCEMSAVSFKFQHINYKQRAVKETNFLSMPEQVFKQCTKMLCMWQLHSMTETIDRIQAQANIIAETHQQSSHTVSVTWTSSKQEEWVPYWVLPLIQE